MPVFKYTAKDSEGDEFSGVYTDISSVGALRSELMKLGYELITATKDVNATSKKPHRLKQSEIVSFAYEFAGMYSAGLSIIKCLETVENQTENDSLSAIVSDIRLSVEAGATLHEAFEKYRDIFSDFFLGMIEAGETGGKLSETLHMAAEYLEQQLETKSKIKAAFAYPIVVSIMCLVIVTALVIFVVPVFQKLYSQLHIELPGPTQILILISVVVRNYWWLVISLTAGLFFGIKKAVKVEAVKQKLDKMMLNMPVFGKLNKMIITSRYIRTFAMMVSAGVSVVESLELAEKVVNNHEVNLMSRDIRQKVLTGSGISAPMSEYNIFPPVIVQLAGAGEEAGVLSEMLIKGVGFLDKKIDKMIKSLIVKIEPILSVIIGAAVGSILMAVYLPMFDYMGKIK